MSQISDLSNIVTLSAGSFSIDSKIEGVTVHLPQFLIGFNKFFLNFTSLTYNPHKKNLNTFACYRVHSCLLERSLNLPAHLVQVPKNKASAADLHSKSKHLVSASKCWANEDSSLRLLPQQWKSFVLKAGEQLAYIGEVLHVSHSSLSVFHGVAYVGLVCVVLFLGNCSSSLEDEEDAKPKALEASKSPLLPQFRALMACWVEIQIRML